MNAFFTLPPYFHTKMLLQKSENYKKGRLMWQAGMVKRAHESKWEEVNLILIIITGYVMFLNPSLSLFIYKMG